MSIYNPEPCLFLTNKFTNAYYFVVNKTQSMNREKRHPGDTDFIYYESHHIIPRSLGGSDEPTNLVLLSAYEHYLCHWLLTKMCISENHRRKMLFPLRCMTNKTKLGSLKNLAKLYELSKSDIALAVSINNSGISRSDEYKAMMKYRMTGKGNHMYGRKHTSETLELMSEAKRGSKNPNANGLSENHRRKIGESQIGKKISEETRQKQRKTYLVTFPDGHQETITNRLEFCKEHGLNDKVFSCRASSGQNYKGFNIFSF